MQPDNLNASNNIEEIHNDLTQISKQIASLQRAFDVLITLMRKYETAVFDERPDIQAQPQFHLA